MPGTRVDQRIHDRLDELTTAERRVADVVLADPESVAFGTVASVAADAGASGATVVRLAGRLGYDGFSALQDAVQAELARRLRPASERIREPAADDVLGRSRRSALEAVTATLDAADPAIFATVVKLLARVGATVHLVCGDASEGVGRQVEDQLASLRRNVSAVRGNAVHVAGMLARVEPGDVVVALDLRRYDRWLLDWVGRARARGATVVGLSDSAVSPLAAVADHHFVLEGDSGGPFDTYVGALALLEAVVAGVGAATRARSTAALDRIEAAWQEADALTE